MNYIIFIIAFHGVHSKEKTRKKIWNFMVFVCTFHLTKMKINDGACKRKYSFYNICFTFWIVDACMAIDTYIEVLTAQTVKFHCQWFQIATEVGPFEVISIIKRKEMKINRFQCIRNDNILFKFNTEFNVIRDYMMDWFCFLLLTSSHVQSWTNFDAFFH